MRLNLISCEVLYREMCAVVARSPNQVDVEFLPKGLHDLGGAAMRDRVQQVVDRVDSTRHEATLLGYALCGNGIAGLTARSVPLVIPRAHDCIALLMGSREKYQSYFEANPGVYYRSTGWLERGEDLEQESLGPVRNNAVTGHSLQELIAKYGEDNGRYLFNEFTSYRKTYRKLTYIATGLGADAGFERRASDEAQERGWQFERLTGDLRLFEQLLAGDWNESDFLIVPPGWRVTATYDENIMGREPAL